MLWRAGVVVGAVVVAGGLLAGCQSSSMHCTNGSCEVSVSGETSVDLDTTSTARAGRTPHGPDTFRVTGYEGDVIRIESSGQTATITAGESARVGRLRFTVKSVRGDSAKLHVEK